MRYNLIRLYHYCFMLTRIIPLSALKNKCQSSPNHTTWNLKDISVQHTVPLAVMFAFRVLIVYCELRTCGYDFLWTITWYQGSLDIGPNIHPCSLSFVPGIVLVIVQRYILLPKKRKEGETLYSVLGEVWMVLETCNTSCQGQVCSIEEDKVKLPLKVF